MAKSFNITLELPQPTIKVSVAFYDEVEEQKLLKYPLSSKLAEVVKTGLEIATEEFLTYYLFHKKRPGKQGWRSYKEVGRKIGYALAELKEWVEFNGDSVSTPSDLEMQDTAITERIGESIGLSVISHVHELTGADWDRIPIGRFRSMDYQIASDGKNIIEVEAKGCSTSDNSVKTSSVSQHKRKIHDKKQQILELETTGHSKVAATIRYGTIAVMGESVEKPVKCLLVDPPADGDAAKAAQFRILQRMRYIADWISFISPRSPFASALQTRIAALERIENPFALDGVPLRKANGQPFDFPLVGAGSSRHSSFFSTKSRITDGPAGGVVVPLPNGNLFFLGIMASLIKQAADQNFGALGDSRFDVGAIRKTVQCIVPEGTLNSYDLPPEILQHSYRYGGYRGFELSGEIHYTNSGTMFGVLPTRQSS